jgi:lipopolysaccharide/colanic/teichoic acid biosynthesis glycosyltransferase
MNTTHNLDNDIISKKEITYNFSKCCQKNDIYKKILFQIFRNRSYLDKKPVQYFIKRFVEINGTFVGLLFLAPLFIAIAVAIKLTSKGSVFFKQKRIGQYGREFYIYKFRSMEIKAEEKLEKLKKYNETNELMFKMFNDPRVTQIGKLLRKYSLDELPQLFNVLKGEMSLVGFRPPLPCEVNEYKTKYCTRFITMPGITGPWQISGRSNIKNFNEVINLEYEYFKTWSLFKDIEILFKTIPVVFLGKDAA